MPVTVGDEVARIIGADPGTVVMHQNVSICQSLILSCFEPTPKRNKIVYSELNFPSVMYVYEAHARDGKLRIETVKSDDGITVPLERMLAAIDEDDAAGSLLARAFQERVFCRTQRQSSSERMKLARWLCSTLINRRAQFLSASKN